MVGIKDVVSGVVVCGCANCAGGDGFCMGTE